MEMGVVGKRVDEKVLDYINATESKLKVHIMHSIKGNNVIESNRKVYAQLGKEGDK